MTEDEALQGRKKAPHIAAGLDDVVVGARVERLRTLFLVTRLDSAATTGTSSPRARASCSADIGLKSGELMSITRTSKRGSAPESRLPSARESCSGVVGTAANCMCGASCAKWSRASSGSPAQRTRSGRAWESAAVCEPCCACDLICGAAGGLPPRCTGIHACARSVPNVHTPISCWSDQLRDLGKHRCDTLLTTSSQRRIHGRAASLRRSGPARLSWAMLVRAPDVRGCTTSRSIRPIGPSPDAAGQRWVLLAGPVLARAGGALPG